MAAVSHLLLQTIVELQQLQGLSKSYLGGGTNLAIRYNHRQSVDIDLFFSDMIVLHVNFIVPRVAAICNA